MLIQIREDMSLDADDVAMVTSMTSTAFLVVTLRSGVVVTVAHDGDAVKCLKELTASINRARSK